jgi:predicted AlkP superfamily pyrophosphatase or phosphodiesterase
MAADPLGGSDALMRVIGLRKNRIPMEYRTRFFCLLALGLPLAAHAAQHTSVLPISLDGLRPGDVLEAEQRGLKIPTLRRFLSDGSYANAVHGVTPTLTYPSHTTLITGVAPAKHGIVSNLTFDPTLKNQIGWAWYAEDIRVPTLWDAAHQAGLRTANEHWPVSVGAQVDFNLPQIWRSGMPDDRKLLKALATPGLLDSMEHELGPYADGIDESIEGDENRARFAVHLIERKHPQFMTAYFTALDHQQHLSGPDTPAAHAALERIDSIVALLLAAARKADPRTVICIVSDHGFAPLHHDVNLFAAFADAGLLRFDASGQISGWDAAPWYNAGAAAIVLREPKDTAVRQRVVSLLDKLRGNAELGIDRVLDREQIAALGGNPQADYWLDFKLDYEMAPDPKAPLLSASHYLGMHGYRADLPEMQSTFLISGPGVPAGHALGQIDMRDIAPTLAKLLGVSLPSAEGKPVF